MAKLGTPKVVPAMGGENIYIVGGEVYVKVSGTDSDGRFFLFETTTAPGDGPPPHVHAREDETFYIIEGDYEFTIAGKTHAAKAGTVVYGVKGVPHAFKNVGKTTGRMLIMTSPAGLDDFFRRAFDEFGRGETDIPKLIQIGEEYGIRFV